MKRPISVRLRIILLFLAAELTLVGAQATATFLYTRDRLSKSFDTALVGNAQAIATLVRQEGAAPPKIDPFHASISRFSRRKRPDVFAVVLDDGTIVGKSGSTKSSPDWIKPTDSKEFRNFRISDDKYRGILLPAHARLEGDPESSEGKGASITVFFATSRDDLDDDLEDILEFLAIAGGATMLLSALAAVWIAKRGLVPMHRLAHEAEKIDATTLDRRFALEKLPPDIRQLGHSFNALLARLESSFERERRFSADAAHELRTPVAVLKSGIQAALLREPDSARDREALNDLLEDTARIEALCESLLVLGRPESEDKRSATLSRDEFSEELGAVVTTMRVRAEASGATIILDPELWSQGALRTDAATTRRILTNLIDNALRHGGSGVAVKVGIAERPNGGVVVAIEDNGPGVPESLKPRLFQRFARGDESRTRATGGSGLGLAISRALAEGYGGSLKFEPRAATGARFVWIVAPAA